MLLDRADKSKKTNLQYGSSPFLLFLVSDRVPLSVGIKPQEKSSERLRVKNNPTYGLLKLLLSVWKEDFGTPVPVQLMFSRKNIGYLSEVKQREVRLVQLRGCQLPAPVPYIHVKSPLTCHVNWWLVWVRPAALGLLSGWHCLSVGRGIRACQRSVFALGLLGRHRLLKEQLAKWPAGPERS